MKLALLLLIVAIAAYNADTNDIPDVTDNSTVENNNDTDEYNAKYLPFVAFIDKDQDNSEYWRETEILSLVRSKEMDIDYEKCENARPVNSFVRIPSRRTVRPICKGQLGAPVLP
ncbi:unnamed protein product [Diatraea saccharalis]|uniref:Uncharacterized protein n=1 Tax=Diatraea saccharalis TaxID=40085 RepID=A0A9N9R991_9NEOP|nr:unnamed protein product [Diatraea saccharalis]